MFSIVCQQVVHEVGKDTLVPSPSLDASKRLRPLNVVTMRKKRKYALYHHKEYTAHDISLSGLLIDETVLNVDVEESKCCTLNHPERTSEMHMTITANNKGIAGASFSAANKFVITVKLGQLHCQEISDESFTSALNKRKLDMNNPFISEIKATKTVLCVVKGVITTSDKAEIKCTDKKNVNMNLLNRGDNSVNADLGVAFNIGKDMLIEPGTVLAYKVWKLRVNGNNGEMIPLMTTKMSGGFSRKKKETTKPLKKVLQPLLDCIEEGGQTLKSSLLDLFSCYGDVVAMSKVLSKAEDGCLNEDKDTFDQQFINIDTVWSILKYVGVQIEDRSVLYTKTNTKLLIAVAYMTDAVLELKNDDLEMICKFNKRQLKALSKILESAVVGTMSIPIDVNTSSVLKEAVRNFLIRLKFTVCNDSIQPPKIKSCIVECIFCVVYCLA